MELRMILRVSSSRGSRFFSFKEDVINTTAVSAIAILITHKQIRDIKPVLMVVPVTLFTVAVLAHPALPIN